MHSKVHARLLLQKGAAIEAVDKYGSTALVVAALCGQLEVTTLLLEHGADIDAVSQDGSSALWAAASKSHLDTLREAAVMRREIGSKGNTALIVAALYGQMELTTLLLEHGANINVVNQDGWSALVAAAFRGHLNIATLLLEKGAAMDAVNVDLDEMRARVDSTHSIITSPRGEVHPHLSSRGSAKGRELLRSHSKVRII